MIKDQLGIEFFLKRWFCFFFVFLLISTLSRSLEEKRDVDCVGIMQAVN